MAETCREAAASRRKIMSNMKNQKNEMMGEMKDITGATCACYNHSNPIKSSFCVSEEWFNLLSLRGIEPKLSWKCLNNNNVCFSFAVHF